MAGSSGRRKRRLIVGSAIAVVIMFGLLYQLGFTSPKTLLSDSNVERIVLGPLAATASLDESREDTTVLHPSDELFGHLIDMYNDAKPVGDGPQTTPGYRIIYYLTNGDQIWISGLYNPSNLSKGHLNLAGNMTWSNVESEELAAFVEIEGLKLGWRPSYAHDLTAE